MSIKLNGKPMEEYLGEQLYEWQDLLVFLADDYLMEFLKDMVNKGELPDLDRDDVFNLHDFLLNKLMNLQEGD